MSYRNKRRPRHRRIRLEQLESRAMLVGDGQFPLIVHQGTPSFIPEGSDFTVTFRLNENEDSNTTAGEEVDVRIDLNNDGVFDSAPQTITVALETDSNPELAVFPFSWANMVAAGIDDGPNPALLSGIYEYVIEVTDTTDDAEVLLDEESLVVDNLIPELQSFILTPVGCGSDVDLNGTLIEMNPDENGLALYIDWDFDSDTEFLPSEDEVLSVGDGLTHLGGNSYSIAASHTYALGGTYTVFLRATADPDVLFPFEDTLLDGINDENELADVEVGSGGSLDADIVGSTTTSVPGQSRQFTANVTQGCGAPGTPTYNWSVTKNNAPFAASTNAAFVFTPDDAGAYEVSLSVTVDGDTVAADPLPFAVNEFVFDSLNGNLAIGSGLGNDTITLSPGSVIVVINGVPVCEHEVTGNVTVYGGAGDDTITVNPAITVPVIIYGGAGNDKLKGGSGPDILLGEDGNDTIVGGAGRDILVGGDGKDAIQGKAEDDILISGILNFGSNLAAALAEIQGEWLSSHNFIARTANIEGWGSSPTAYLLNSTTVLDDNDKDTLAGDQGIDWFFANLWIDCGDDANHKDKIEDISVFELLFANDLDF